MGGRLLQAEGIACAESDTSWSEFLGETTGRAGQRLEKCQAPDIWGLRGLIKGFGLDPTSNRKAGKVLM
jgi:hypothetical protein